MNSRIFESPNHPDRDAKRGNWAAVAVAVGTIALSGCSGKPKEPPSSDASSGRPSVSPLSAVESPGDPAPKDPTAPPKARDWYVPQKADFRPEYDRDAVNQSRESWDNYWSWITQFYDGNLFAQGWTKQSEDLLDGVRAEKTRAELRAALNALGRRAAAEWSKDNGVRKLDTNDLRTFGNRLQQAKRRDDGSGSSLRSVIGTIAAGLETKLARP